MPTTDALRAHWRCALGAAVACAVAFVCGRGCAPEPRIEVREVERVRVQVVESVRVEQVKARDTAAESHRVVERTRIEQPGGPTITHEIERDDTATTTHETVATQAERKTETQAEVERERQVTVDPYRPAWRVGVLAGLEVLELRPTYGAHVERRIAGPVFVGAWGLASGTAGVSLSFEF